MVIYDFGDILVKIPEKIFEKARQTAPTIVFFDEIDRLTELMEESKKKK